MAKRDPRRISERRISETAIHPVGFPRHRLSVDKLNDDQLTRLRSAVAKAAARKDNKSWAWWAGLHGVPDHYCQHRIESDHGRRFFLPWHRAYLYRFELALRDLEPGVTLPWWDWSFDAEHPRFIPDSYKGSASSNPLAGQAIPNFNIAAQPTATKRANNPPSSQQQPTWEHIDKVLLNIKDYFTFSLELEKIHDTLHGYIGGTMASINWSAYDPLFYAHHVMIDRIWALWQDRNGIQGPTPDMFEEVLEPFNLKIPQVLEIGHLGYTYAASVSVVGGNS